MPDLRVGRADPVAILEMREAYRREMDAQIVHDSFHARGFTDVYLLHAGDALAGYGAVAGDPHPPRETVKELYLVPGHRALARDALRALVEASGARRIEAQTNDPLLGPLVGEFTIEAVAERLLFAYPEGAVPGAPDPALRALDSSARAHVFTHAVEPVGEWGLEAGGAIVATGGILSHYNPPWVDLHMEVHPDHRRRGFGTRIVRELVRIARERGLRPAARCRVENVASRRTLEGAGLHVCGQIVGGRIR